MATATAISKPEPDWSTRLIMRRREAEARRIEACLERGLSNYLLSAGLWALVLGGIGGLSMWMAFRSHPHFDGGHVAVATIAMAVLLTLLVAAACWRNIPGAVRYLRNPSVFWVPREVGYLTQLVVLPQLLSPLLFFTGSASGNGDLEAILAMLGIVSFVVSIWCAVISVRSNMNLPLRWPQKLLLGFWASSLVGIGIESGASIWLAMGYRDFAVL